VNVMEGTGKYSAQISGRQQESPMYLVGKRCQVDSFMQEVGTSSPHRVSSYILLFNRLFFSDGTNSLPMPAIDKLLVSIVCGSVRMNLLNFGAYSLSA
jgi:hypothetical protein